MPRMENLFAWGDHGRVVSYFRENLRDRVILESSPWPCSITAILDVLSKRIAESFIMFFGLIQNRRRVDICASAEGMCLG